MKAIQITIDDQLLSALDHDPEVKRDGRSAVIRRAAFDYLRRKKRASIAEAYRRGYGKEGADEFGDWPAEGSWPEP